MWECLQSIRNCREPKVHMKVKLMNIRKVENVLYVLRIK